MGSFFIWDTETVPCRYLGIPHPFAGTCPGKADPILNPSDLWCRFRLFEEGKQHRLTRNPHINKDVGKDLHLA